MLIINEIANNHQGSIEIGKKIVDGLVPLKKRYPEFDFAIKLQLRNLETFIHPDYKTRFDLPHIQRFMETKLSDIKILELCNYIKERGFKLGITAFDENALEFIETFCSPDFLKIASCCANEWSLINKICETDRYIIASTGGLNWDETDNLYHFLKHKKKDFSLMHCVGIYPAPMEEMDLNIIEKMKKRYECLIGFSDHSFKQSFEAGQIAIAKGAEIFERHVCLDDLGNAYSLPIENINMWLDSLLTSKILCGSDSKNISVIEKKGMEQLKRGVWAKSTINKGEIINEGNTFLAFPAATNQLLSENFSKYRQEFIAEKEYTVNEFILKPYIPNKENATNKIRKYVHRAVAMLNENNIKIAHNCTCELSHHYGLDRFEEFGGIIFSLINRQYCKKVIVLFPGQKYPLHYHKDKEETFRVLSGDLDITIDSINHKLKAGECILVDRYRQHDFTTESGVVFEEISTTHVMGDSYYVDTEIYKMDPLERKTSIEKI